MSAVRVVDEHLLSPVLVYSGSGGVFENELQLDTQGGILREQIGNLLIVKNDFNVVPALTGSVFTGPVVFSSGLTGSLQTLSDGTPYLVAGPGINISTGSSGQVTIAATAAPDTGNRNNSVGVVTELVLNETPAGVIDGVNKQFTLAFMPTDPTCVMIWLNGQLLSQGSERDYTVSGKSILFERTSLESGDALVAMYPKSASVKRFSLNEEASIESISGSLGLKIENVPDPAQSLMVFRNGQLLTFGADYFSSEKLIHMMGGSIAKDDIFLVSYSYTESTT